MEIDVIHPDWAEGLARGDLLLIAQKGAYGACMAAPFIQGIPALVATSGRGEFDVLRSRTDDTLLVRLHGPAKRDRSIDS